MPKNPNAKTVSIPRDVQLALQYYVLSKKGRARNFSEALTQGARLLLNRAGTSVERVLRENAAAK